jgi:intracellular multiplication protein IcmL
VHWREQLQDASANFTPDGWKYFQAALTDSNDLKTLVDLKMVSDAQITGAPSITRKAIISGHYAWVVQLPVLIAFTSAGKNINQPINLTVVVVREPVDSYPQKIAINNIFSGTVSPSAYK